MTTERPTPEQLEQWRQDAEHRRTTTPGPTGLPQERRGESRPVEVPPSLDALGARVYGYGGAVGSTHVAAPANGGQVAAYGRGGEHASDNETDLGKIGRRMFGF
ncbi:hypothetical protein [Corynebacterium glyciniphilum]|uniref:hypothetical protein n=1 Tax=Corynebacterium glyciniphilum TaxID=1404244 RepID=UPI003FD1B235